MNLINNEFNEKEIGDCIEDAMNPGTQHFDPNWEKP